MPSSIITQLVAIVATLTATTQSGAPVDAGHYANQTPYGNPVGASVLEAPDGYRLTFVETVGRHGARTLTSSARERRSLKIWQRAEQAGALTEVGEGLADDIAAFKEPEQHIGYGNLTAVGVAEWQGIGRRTAADYRQFLAGAAARGDDVVFKTSPVQRTVESADAMRQGLEQTVPGLRVADYVTDAPRLLIGNGASMAGNRATRQVLSSPEVVAASTDVLERLYDPEFVSDIDDPVDAALDLYLLYSTAPGMAAETEVTFEPYVPLVDAQVLAYAVDAENFYQYGPGVAGEDSSYRAARPLLDDFFTALDERLAGGTTAAVFRLAHGETTMPFAALMGLPGSDVQATRTYTYADNPWRGDKAGRLGGNVEWAAYVDAAGEALVTIRYDEQPVELGAACTPVEPSFYRPAELRRCLG